MSKKSSNQPPQQHKTQEQLIKEAEDKKEIERKRLLVKEGLYPLVVNSTKSVREGRQFLMVITNSIRQQFMSQMRVQRLVELKLTEKIDKNMDKDGHYAKVLELLSGETVADAVSLTEGLEGAIASFVEEEMAGRPLESLKTDFL